MDGADAGAGEDGDGQFRDHGQVEGHPVALAHAQALEDVGATADLPVQLLVGEGAGLLGALPFPDEGGLVLAPGLQVAVQAVIGDIELTAQEPAMLAAGEVRLQGPLPLVKPVQPFGLFGPEGRGVLDAAGVEFPVGRQGADPGPGGELRGRGKDASLGQGGGNGRPVRHVVEAQQDPVEPLAALVVTDICHHPHQANAQLDVFHLIGGERGGAQLLDAEGVEGQAIVDQQQVQFPPPLDFRQAEFNGKDMLQAIIPGIGDEIDGQLLRRQVGGVEGAAVNELGLAERLQGVGQPFDLGDLITQFQTKGVRDFNSGGHDGAGSRLEGLS